MKVFFDECVPRPLRRLLAAHEIKTAQEMGWGRLNNGVLIALLVLPTNFWPTLRENQTLIAVALATIREGKYRELVV